MNIQWYPGHMTKARRDMQEDVKAVDLIIELTDARAPLATRNPDIEKLGAGKARIILMNKADLAEEAVSFDWVRFFKQKGYDCFFMDARNKNNLKRLLSLIESVCAAKRERDRKRGILNRPVRAMVAGIPNVGKSTLINTIAGRTTAKTGNKPGVTKGNQWIRLNKSVELLDTPGILWPKFEDPEIGLLIAFIGSVNEMIVDERELALELIRFLRKDHGELLDMRYGCEGLSGADTLKRIAEKRGALLSGGLPDYDKAAGILLTEFRSGILGRISLQKPPKSGFLAQPESAEPTAESHAAGIADQKNTDG